MIYNMDNQTPSYSSGYTRSEHLNREEEAVYSEQITNNIFLRQVVPITLAIILFIILVLSLGYNCFNKLYVKPY